MVNYIPHLMMSIDDLLIVQTNKILKLFIEYLLKVITIYFYKNRYVFYKFIYL